MLLHVGPPCVALAGNVIVVPPELSVINYSDGFMPATSILLCGPCVLGANTAHNDVYDSQNVFQSITGKKLMVFDLWSQIEKVNVLS